MSQPNVLDLVRLTRTSAAAVVALCDVLLYSQKSDRSSASLRLPTALYRLERNCGRLLAALREDQS